MHKHDSGDAPVATYADIKSILGDIGSQKLLAIRSLYPTIAEVEETSIWLSGDSDAFGAIEPIKGNASHIITILTTEEEIRTG